MNKKIVFGISVVINIFLACLFLSLAAGAGEELKFSYVEMDTITPDTLRKYLEWENYGVAAELSHSIRGGAEIEEQYLDYYRLGEYADLLFLKEVFVEAGNAETVKNFEDRLDEIRTEMPDYGSLFEKIEFSAKNAIPEKK